jgi:hypothetical protein
MWKRAIGAFLAVLISAGSSLSQTAHAPFRIASQPSSGNFSHHRFARPFYAGFPLWPDYLPSNETPPPSVIVVQAPAPIPVTKSEEPKSSAPLLIEWQGDRYVRRTPAAANLRTDQPDYIADAKPGGTTSTVVSNHAPKQAEPVPTTFIFRDGHREQSSDYSIISGIIYARLDYWTAGQWSKQIRLSDLDLPATFKANQELGVKFRIPAAPNEVVTRP